jgi:hypothetical protein
MKWPKMRRVEQQARYMAAMMARLAVDGVAATREGRGIQFAAASRRCLMCNSSVECEQWLADPNRGSEAPEFCPNAEFFSRHRTHPVGGKP